MKLLADFVPLPNSPGNRYIVSPTVNDVRDQFGMRFDYQISGNQSVLGRYMRSDTDRTTPRVIAAVDQKSLATLQDFMVSHNYVISSNVINQARFSINRITANPAVTSGLSPRRLRHQLRQHQSAGGGPAVVRHRRASSAAAPRRWATRSSRS